MVLFIVLLQTGINKKMDILVIFLMGHYNYRILNELKAIYFDDIYMYL